jgi:hypothetical protein
VPTSNVILCIILNTYREDAAKIEESVEFPYHLAPPLVKAACPKQPKDPA